MIRPSALRRSHPDVPSSTLAGRLIAIMRTLIQAANEAGVTLNAAAVKNLAKVFDRCGSPPIRPRTRRLTSGVRGRLTALNEPRQHDGADAYD